MSSRKKVARERPVLDVTTRADCSESSRGCRPHADGDLDRRLEHRRDRTRLLGRARDLVQRGRIYAGQSFHQALQVRCVHPDPAAALSGVVALTGTRVE